MTSACLAARVGSLLCLILLPLAAGCGGKMLEESSGHIVPDAALPEASRADTSVTDAPSVDVVGPTDTGPPDVILVHETSVDVSPPPIDVSPPPIDVSPPPVDVSPPPVDVSPPPKDSGFDAGHDSGFDAGHDAGFDSGFDAGHDSGFDAGFDSGFDSGFDAGHDAGFDSGFDAGHDSGFDGGADAAPYPAAHPAFPTDTPSGGPVLTTPIFMPVFYSGDSEQTTLTTLLTDLGASAYWAATTSEYGVMGATMGTPIVLTMPPPVKIDDSAIQNYLAKHLDGTDPVWGTPGPEDVYVIFYPASTTITQNGFQSCSYFGGYHNETANALGVIRYVVLPRCTGIPPLSDEQQLTEALSHELVETATDPQPNTKPAYLNPDNNDIAWGLIAGGELGDMCEFVPNIWITPAAPFDYTVQRTWSNVSAAASHDPCVPIPAGEVYFNSAPVLGDPITLNQGGPIPTEGVKITLGSSGTIPVNLFSDGATSGPWTVQAVDVASYYNGEPTALTFSWDKTTGNNGDVLHLTITAHRQDPMYGGELFMLVSTLGGMQTLWFGAVGN